MRIYKLQKLAKNIFKTEILNHILNISDNKKIIMNYNTSPH